MFEYYARVHEVIDGDTIDVSVDLGFSIQHLIRLRLYGINTPELRSKDPAEKVMAVTAKNRLIGLIEGKIVKIKTFKDKTDKYGRYLAEVFSSNNESINNMLLTEGLAKEYKI